MAELVCMTETRNSQHLLVTAIQVWKKLSNTTSIDGVPVRPGTPANTNNRNLKTWSRNKITWSDNRIFQKPEPESGNPGIRESWYKKDVWLLMGTGVSQANDKSTIFYDIFYQQKSN